MPASNMVSPPLDQATAIGHQLRLGPVVHLFLRETGSPIEMLRAFAVLGLALVLCVVPAGLSVVHSIPVGAGLLPVAGALAGLFFLIRGMVNRAPRREWLFLYEGGLVLLDHRGQYREVAPWTEVYDADWRWDAEGDGLSSYRVRLRNGRLVPLRTDWRNVYDPYGPAGDLMRVLPGGPALPRFPSLADVLGDTVVEPAAQRVLAQLAAGGRVPLGAVTVDATGIAYGSRKFLRWDEITGWDVDRGYLVLRGPRKLVVPLRDVDSGWVLARVTCGALGGRAASGPAGG